MNNRTFITPTCCPHPCHRDDAFNLRTTLQIPAQLIMHQAAQLNSYCSTLVGALHTSVSGGQGKREVMILGRKLFYFVLFNFLVITASDRNYQSPQQSNLGSDLLDLLDGVDLNLLDSKLIGFGFVRQQLVEEVCLRATRWGSLC